MKRIGIIGFGNMGQAIAWRTKAAYEVWVFDKDKSKTKNISGLNVSESAKRLINDSQAVILAVKPQDFDALLKEIKDYTIDKLIVSIAAGISTSYIEARTSKARVVRAMPNLPARIGAGVICLYKGITATDGDLNFCEELFKSLGKTLTLADEDKINAATAVSGSGPGFLFSLIQPLPESMWVEFGNRTFTPALIIAAEQIGFSAKEAMILASGTTSGSIALLKSTPGLTPESLCFQVASPGGTTEAGLKVLQGKIEHLPIAVQAAKKRAEELSKGG